MGLWEGYQSSMSYVFTLPEQSDRCAYLSLSSAIKCHSIQTSYISYATWGTKLGGTIPASQATFSSVAHSLFWGVHFTCNIIIFSFHLILSHIISYSWLSVDPFSYICFFFFFWQHFSYSELAWLLINAWFPGGSPVYMVWIPYCERKLCWVGNP